MRNQSPTLFNEYTVNTSINEGHITGQILIRRSARDALIMTPQEGVGA